MQYDQARQQFIAVQNALEEQLIGRSTLIERLMCALLCEGHVLLEGAPGLAKTRAIKQFANSVEAQFSRVQATPDLLPSDLTGTTVFRQHTGEFEFVRGPLFSNVVLFDEINRAPPKVQSALLEAMGEQQISVGGNTYPLSQPFLVAATQNPIEHEGTFPLPEAQLDRFLFFINIPMPNLEEERAILDLMIDDEHSNAASESPVISELCLNTARQAIREVHIAPAVRDYIVRLSGATRGLGAGGEASHAHILHPSSPRGSIGLAIAARAKAWLASRDHVLPSDVSELASDVLSGRVGLNYQAQAEGLSPRQVIDSIVEQTPVV